MRSTLLLVLVLALGCGSKGEESKESKESAKQPAAKPAPADAATAEPAPKAPVARKLTAAERKKFKAHLREGRALQKQDKWSESVAALELAIALQPTSDRALSELSWAAFKAGQLDRAAEAAEDAIAFAIDPRLKAASLYNLGRIDEARKKPGAAITAYQRSLRLRPNKTVKRQLLGLGGKVPQLVSVPSCASFQPMEALCKCLRAAHDLEIEEVPEWPGRYGGRCQAAGDERQGFQQVIVTLDDNQRARAGGEYFLTMVKGDKRAVVADLGSVFESHKFNETSELTGVETQTIGGNQLYRITATKVAASDEEYAAIAQGIIEKTTDERLLLCVEVEGFVKCPVEVLLAHSYSATLLDDVEDTDPAEAASFFEEQFGHPAPITRGFELDVAIGEDGSAEVTHKSGDKGPKVDRYLGRHQLW